MKVEDFLLICMFLCVAFIAGVTIWEYRQRLKNSRIGGRRKF